MAAATASGSAAATSAGSPTISTSGLRAPLDLAFAVAAPLISRWIPFASRQTRCGRGGVGRQCFVAGHHFGAEILRLSGPGTAGHAQTSASETAASNATVLASGSSASLCSGSGVMQAWVRAVRRAWHVLVLVVAGVVLKGQVLAHKLDALPA